MLGLVLVLFMYSDDRDYEITAAAAIGVYLGQTDGRTDGRRREENERTRRNSREEHRI